MTLIDAVATGPVLFFTTYGHLIEVPTDTIKFDGNDVNTTMTIDASMANLQGYLRYLASIGQLVRGEVLTVASLTATAVLSETTGNRITILVSPPTGNPATVDITVTQVDTFTGVKLSTLDATIGNTTSTSWPGLLRVKANDVGAPAPADAVVDVGTGADVNTWTIAANAGATKKVVLEPVRAAVTDGYAAADFTVTISDVQGATAADTTFTLTARWQHKITAVAASATLPAAKFDELKYLVTFTAPATGFTLPNAGTTTLVGGLAPSAGQPAATTLLASI